MDSSRKPHPKVAAGGIAGAASILIVFVLGQVGVDVPAEVASAITVLISGVAAYVKQGAA